MNFTRRYMLASIGAVSLTRAESSLTALWNPDIPMPATAGLQDVPDVRFHVIKAHEPERDGGYGFLHGVALVWHKRRLYASWGNNKRVENTSGEEARGSVSTDGGRTWGEVFTIDAAGGSPGLAVSHGSFLSHRGRLWAFLGAFYGNRERVHTRAYVLDERSHRWEYRGVAVQDGFWPMQAPLPLPGGNWIMAGFQVGNGEPASVAISRGDDFAHWDHIVIPRASEVKKMWGESTVIVQDRRVLDIARYGDEARALVSTSDDGGRHWTPMAPSNMPMATSKPYAGTLSTGQRYLIGTTTTDSGKRRSPLTIAVSRPGGPYFSRVFRIRSAEHSAARVESHPRAALSYPYAVEHDQHLYVGYSNNAGRPGMNINSAELAVIPMAALQIPSRR